jgi:hypothetical protein
VNLVPSPPFDSTEMCPTCIPTIAYAIISPGPGCYPLLGSAARRQALVVLSEDFSNPIPGPGRALATSIFSLDDRQEVIEVVSDPPSQHFA